MEFYGTTEDEPTPGGARFLDNRSFEGPIVTLVAAAEQYVMVAMRKSSLIEGPLHGYAIVRRASELSGGAVRLSTGTLYALLERATEEGLVVAGEPYYEGGRKRRDYALTPHGRSELNAEAERLSRAGQTVKERLRATATAVSP